MSKVISRLMKRRIMPLNIDAETVVYVRALTIGEIVASNALEFDKRTGFVLGCALIDDSGQQEFPKAEGESNADYSDRVLTELADVPLDSIAAISAAIEKAAKVPSVDSIAKN